MDTNTAYRSVFEKGRLEFEVLVVFEPEATAFEDGAAALAGGGTAEDLLGGDGTDGFTEAAARLMAARPLVLTPRG
jgi:hypothetical protein